MLDIGTLIQEVYHRPCLWDQRDKEYYNRECVNRNWEEVGVVLGVNYELAKCKWKHLRDNYRAELKKVLKTAGEEDEQARYRSSWVWFDSLFFLKEFVLSKGKKVRHSIVTEEDPLSLTSPVRMKVEPDMKTEYDEPSISSEHSETMFVSAQDAEAVRKRKVAYGGDAEEVTMKRSRPEVEDDCHHFVLSLIPSLRRLPLQNQMLVRAKIYELIYEENVKTHGNEK